MKKDELRIVYMGTPEFAVESLRALVEKGYTIVGVITVPDKPVGRHGSVLQPSPVKEYAESKHIPVLQPEKLKDDLFLSRLREWKADLQIVVAFRMLPEVVWDMPRLGTFNLHASLLPQYRGAAPINRAVINGETETGVTTFFLTHEIDTGKIIRQTHIPIADTDDAGIVHDKLMEAGAALVVETVDLVLSGQVDTISQEQLYQHFPALYPAPKINKETCRINWNLPLKQLYEFVRGLSPYPAAWTELLTPGGDKQVLKIYQTEKRPASHPLPTGTIVTDNRKYIDIAVPGGYIRLLSLQVAGKKRMNATDFLNGFKQLEGYSVTI
jgi:methionyl-tRNA formyltransferase